MPASGSVASSPLWFSIDFAILILTSVWHVQRFRAWGKQAAGSSLEAPDGMGLAGRAWPTAMEPGKVSLRLGSAQAPFGQLNADGMILILKMSSPHPYYGSELAFLASQGVPGQYPVMHNVQRQTSPCQSWPVSPSLFPRVRPFSTPQQPLLLNG